eukprot:1551347-Pleurochrysis_carterae.AAC.1
MQLAELLKKGHDSAAVRAKNEDQRLHSEWFMRQRRELDVMRHSGGRHDTLFEQAILFNHHSMFPAQSCYRPLKCFRANLSFTSAMLIRSPTSAETTVYTFPAVP